jgi:transcriptional regulator with XRE-family HTH domain
MISQPPAPLGEHLRDWRQRRRMTQLDLAGAAGISTRHLSFLETGRSLPSRAMLLRLATLLEVPLRQRNALMVAAGYAPLYREHRLDEAEMAVVREAIDRILQGHEPYPALAIDRHWHLAAANRSALALLDGVDASLLQPPVNVLRISLHPRGLAPRIANLGEWRAHLLARLRHQHATTLDPVLSALIDELEAYPGDETGEHSGEGPPGGILVPLQLRAGDAVLSLFSTTTVFGTPRDVTVAELAIESFFPADAATAAALRAR